MDYCYRELLSGCNKTRILGDDVCCCDDGTECNRCPCRRRCCEDERRRPRNSVRECDD